MMQHEHLLLSATPEKTTIQKQILANFSSFLRFYVHEKTEHKQLNMRPQLGLP